MTATSPFFLLLLSSVSLSLELDSEELDEIEADDFADLLACT